MFVANSDVIACLDTAAVCDLCDLNRSTLDYWVRTGLVTPSLRAEPGRRRTRLWTVQDATVVRMVTELRRSGCSLRRIRLASQRLEEEWAGLQSDTVLVWNGVDILLLNSLGSVESLLQHPKQQVLRLVALPVGSWADEATAGVSYIQKANLRFGVPASTPQAAREAK
jgi:DNA-binding transcriptional MerR regulator